MYDISEKLSSASKASVDTLVNMANTAFGGMERLAALNLNAARTLMEDGAARTRALLEVKDVKSLVSLQSMMAQPGLQKATVYSRSVCRIAADTQEALSEVVEGQVSEFSQSASQALDEAAKRAPPGSDLGVNAMRSALAAAGSAYDSMIKASKQVAEMAEATLAVASVANSSRKPV
ncbi:MAG: phasin family protein [Sulfuritalea sp.]|nr:phasin family protein [Sulfuritalea sp.]